MRWRGSTTAPRSRSRSARATSWTRSNAKGWRIDTLHVAGGHTKNPLLMELYADTTGCRVIEPAEDAVLLGAAMTAAVAAGLQPSLAEAAAAMSRSAGERAARPGQARRASIATTAPSC